MKLASMKLARSKLTLIGLMHTPASKKFLMSYRERVIRRQLETVGALIAPGLEMSPWAARYWTQVYRQLTLAGDQPDPTPIDSRPDPD